MYLPKYRLNIHLWETTTQFQDSIGERVGLFKADLYELVLEVAEKLIHCFFFGCHSWVQVVQKSSEFRQGAAVATSLKLSNHHETSTNDPSPERAKDPGHID